MKVDLDGESPLSIEEEALLDEVAESVWRCPDRAMDDETDEKPLRDDEYEALAPLLESGFEVVGSGIARVVLKFPDETGLSGHVVKIGRFGDDLLSIGMWQNRNEVKVWGGEVCEYGDEASAIAETALMPIVHYQPALFRWVVMPEASSVPASEEESAVEQVKEQMEDSSAELHSTEYQPVNIGLYKGQPRLLDYGRPHERSLRNFLAGVPEDVDDFFDG